jgi:hypothetical protein
MPSLFKTVGAVLCLAFALCFAAPNAHADSYSATFTVTVGLAPLPTALDVTFPSPTLDITWQGAAFAITLPSSSLSTDSYIWGNDVLCNNGICTSIYISLIERILVLVFQIPHPYRLPSLRPLAI